VQPFTDFDHGRPFLGLVQQTSLGLPTGDLLAAPGVVQPLTDVPVGGVDLDDRRERLDCLVLVQGLSGCGWRSYSSLTATS
jgi:hypothetical protein